MKDVYTKNDFFKISTNLVCFFLIWSVYNLTGIEIGDK